MTGRRQKTLAGSWATSWPSRDGRHRWPASLSETQPFDSWPRSLNTTKTAPMDADQIRARLETDRQRRQTETDNGTRYTTASLRRFDETMARINAAPTDWTRRAVLAESNLPTAFGDTTKPDHHPDHQGDWLAVPDLSWRGTISRRRPPRTWTNDTTDGC